MFKGISSDDRSIKEFKTYKQFTFTHSDSGSGVFGLEGISGSFHNFLTGSAASQSFGVFNSDSKSLGHSWDTWYSCGTFFKLPLYYQIRNSYYQYDTIPNPKSTVTRFPIYSGGNWSRKYPYNREDWGAINPRQLGDTVNVITIPQEYFGEEVKPYSVKILDDSSDVTIDLRDDGYGQLYDYAYSSSFATSGPHNLRGYWNFDGTAKDRSGMGNHGTLVNSPTYVTGKSGQALSFNRASAQQVNVGTKINGSVDSGRGIAVSAWVYPTGTTGHRGIFFKNKVIHMRVQGGDNKIVAFINNSGLSGSMIDDWQVSGNSGGGISVEVLPANEWSHVVVQYTNDDTQIKAYIDATEVTYHAKATVAPGKINTNSSDAIIGGGSPHLSHLYMEGYIDEVRVYDRPLTANEITGLYINPPADQAATGVSSSYLPDESTGNCVGNVFYEHGIVTITDTGSYANVGLGTGGDGWSVKFQATKTSNEYEYLCHIDEYQFTGTTNPSAVVGRSGSIQIPQGARYNYDGNWVNPQYESTADLLLPAASSSYLSSYSAGTEYQSFTTHSEFGTYVTNIGLYNDTKELLAIAKLSNPIKNDKDLPISFLVRFDS